MHPVETVDIVELEQTCHELRLCWLEAKSHASVFEILLCDSLDVLLLAHTAKSSQASRRRDDWNRTLVEKAPLLRKKKDLYLMMNPKKRRILYKLLAWHYIQGDSQVALCWIT